VPKNKTDKDKTTVWIPKSLHKVLKQRALDKNKSIERVVNEILKEKLKPKKKEKK